MSLETTERETYAAMWGVEEYANYSPGEKFADVFLDMAGVKDAKRCSVLDAGCGSGKGALALLDRGFGNVRLCDITDAGLVPEARALRFDEVCLWRPLRQQLGYMQGGAVDYVYCTDVLEHVPTPFTMLVISQLLTVAARGVFFSIALHPDDFGVFIGKPLHQTVEGFCWWKNNLNALGTVTACRDLGKDGLYYVEPRR
jgi:SAM-dependent methyltransferase